MLDPKEYMLTCIREEVCELGQVCGKVDRFGLYDINPNTGTSNDFRMDEEFHDVLATYMEYCRLNNISFRIDETKITSKLRRVYIYKLYSYLKDRTDLRG